MQMYVSAYYYMCPHTSYVCVRILRYVCPHGRFTTQEYLKQQRRLPPCEQDLSRFLSLSAPPHTHTHTLTRTQDKIKAQRQEAEEWSAKDEDIGPLGRHTEALQVF
jgi:hypothetical protein